MSPTLQDRAFSELSSAEAYWLWLLRQQVFVVEQRSPYPDLDGRDVAPSTRHLTLTEDGGLVGCLRMTEEDTHLRIGRVALAPESRGRGWARLLIDAAVRRVGARACRLDAQTPLVGFYAGWGFVVDGPEFIEDGVAHVPMLRGPGG